MNMEKGKEVIYTLKDDSEEKIILKSNNKLMEENSPKNIKNFDFKSKDENFFGNQTKNNMYNNNHNNLEENSKISLEKLYTLRKIKSTEGLKKQLDKKETDKHYDKNLLNQIFSIKEINKFLSSNFELVDTKNDVYIQKMENKDWNKFDIDQNADITGKFKDSNLILKNKIIKLEKSCLNLHNLAVSVNMDIIMSGESSLLIFSRISDSLSSESTVCQISKEFDSSTKFLKFGVLLKKRENENFHLKTIRKQEIPRHDSRYNQNLDISYLKISFIDNGDNRLFVSIDNEFTNKKFLFSADFYFPVEDNSNLMIAATGDLISIKNFEIKQIERNLKFKNFERIDEKSTQTCSCCQSF